LGSSLTNINFNRCSVYYKTS